jgi:hypothetical protein
MKISSSEQGTINALLVPLILACLLFFGALGFGTWAFMGREDYKNNADKKIDEAVEIAVKRTETAKDNEFVEREKEPLRTYKGPSALGSVTVKYPKTWSVYVDESDGDEVVALFNPRYVYADRSREKVAHALTMTVESTAYDKVVSAYDRYVSNGEAKSRPYALPNKPKIVGLRVDGTISSDHKGSVVILPLRDKTIILSTLSNQYVGDFNNIILKNFDFIP